MGLSASEENLSENIIHTFLASIVDPIGLTVMIVHIMHSINVDAIPCLQ